MRMVSIKQAFPFATMFNRVLVQPGLGSTGSRWEAADSIADKVDLLGQEWLHGPRSREDRCT